MKAIRVAICASILGPLLLTATAALAQESKISMQAIRCAAIFSVIAETHAEDQRLAKTFQETSALFSDVYIKERGAQTNKDNQQGASQRRDFILQELQNTYREREALILEETILCGSWAEGFRAQGDSYAFVPIIPKIIPQKTREEYAGLATQAFKRWVK